MKAQDINRKEVYRYLGYSNIVPDEKVNSIIDEVISDGLKLITPRSMFDRLKISVINDEIIFYEKNSDDKTIIALKSKNLSDNLRGCEEAIIFAATLGIEADSYIKKLSVINMAKASVAQSVFAAMIEAYCNLMQEEIRVNVSKENLYLKPRFSPGYGDLRLDTQKNFFEMMEITKRLGITLTDSLLMFPTKSVTAFIGLTKNPLSCHINKCKTCTNKECEFRNEEDN